MFCCWGELNPREKEELSREWKELSKKEKKQRILTCIRRRPTQHSKGKEEQRDQYLYFARPPLTNDPEKWRCCRKLLASLVGVAEQTLRNWGKKIAEEGELRPHPNLGGLRTPCNGTGTPPTSEETWQQIEHFIINSVPRYPVVLDANGNITNGTPSASTSANGQEQWVVGYQNDPSQTKFNFNRLVAMCNSERELQGLSPIKKWQFKHAWYVRLKLRGVWRFSHRLESPTSPGPSSGSASPPPSQVTLPPFSFTAQAAHTTGASGMGTGLPPGASASVGAQFPFYLKDEQVSHHQLPLHLGAAGSHHLPPLSSTTASSSVLPSFTAAASFAPNSFSQASSSSLLQFPSFSSSLSQAPPPLSTTPPNRHHPQAAAPYPQQAYQQHTQQPQQQPPLCFLCSELVKAFGAPTATDEERFRLRLMMANHLHQGQCPNSVLVASSALNNQQHHQQQQQLHLQHLQQQQQHQHHYQQANSGSTSNAQTNPGASAPAPTPKVLPIHTSYEHEAFGR